MAWIRILALFPLVSAAEMQTVDLARNNAEPYNGSKPNIVFLICESTDGRLYDLDGAAPIPNIRALQKRGSYFQNFYVNSPVCAPSRSSLWSGRHVHNIPHENQGVKVNGAWNNAEGNSHDFNFGWTNVLTNSSWPDGNMEGSSVVRALLTPRRQANGAIDSASYIPAPATGKTDWRAGGHALWNWLQCWTMYVQFPYNLSAGGWNEQPGDKGCGSNGTVGSGNFSHLGDWSVVDRNTKWLRESASSLPGPFLVYQGANIVHPDYVTVEKWFNKIDANATKVPEWQPLRDLHPCDLQSSMLKGCVPQPKDAGHFYSTERRLRIRMIYLAMIAEFDAMVGTYMQAVEDIGMTDKTVFIVTSDHGDMDMEHQQFYKMVPYDASSRVPLVVAGPGIKQNQIFTRPASLVDLYPTILDLAGLELPAAHPGIDGTSLLPWLSDSLDVADSLANIARHPPVMSQGHMADNAISWYLLRDVDMKLIVYGTGKENKPQLFNITQDPSESVNLARKPEFAGMVKSLTEKLQKIIDFPSVSQDVAKYNKAMFTDFYMKNYDWQTTLPLGRPNGLPGGPAGTAWPQDMTPLALDAVKRWLQEPVEVKPCRGASVTSNKLSMASLVV